MPRQWSRSALVSTDDSICSFAIRSSDLMTQIRSMVRHNFVLAPSSCHTQPAW